MAAVPRTTYPSEFNQPEPLQPLTEIKRRGLRRRVTGQSADRDAGVSLIQNQEHIIAASGLECPVESPSFGRKIDHDWGIVVGRDAPAKLIDHNRIHVGVDDDGAMMPPDQPPDLLNVSQWETGEVAYDGDLTSLVAGID